VYPDELGTGRFQTVGPDPGGRGAIRPGERDRPRRAACVLGDVTVAGPPLRAGSAVAGTLRGVRSFLRGAVQLHVLHHAAEGPIHGAWMSQELARHGQRISPGTLYPTLHRLEQEGLLHSREDLVEGRRRRLYTATADGRRALEQTRAVLRELADEVLSG